MERGEWRERERRRDEREVEAVRGGANAMGVQREFVREREVGATALHSLTSLSGCHRPVPAASFAPPVSRSRLVDVMNIHRRPDTHTDTHYLTTYLLIQFPRFACALPIKPPILPLGCGDPCYSPPTSMNSARGFQMLLPWAVLAVLVRGAHGREEPKSG